MGQVGTGAYRTKLKHMKKMAIYRLQNFSTFAFFILVSFSLLSGPGISKVQAFEDASEIHHTYLNQENFLDIKSYQFHKLQDEVWSASPGGWRLSGGSMGLDLLFSHFEMRLPHSLSEETTVFFRAQQEEFYEIKPFRYLVEVEWRPYDIAAFSLLGMPEYDKRKADQGASITLGKRPWKYLRFQQLFQDLYYNEKNFYDDSYYSPHPLEKILEGAFSWNNWRASFSHLLDLPFKQVFPKQGLTFNYKGQDSSFMLDYHFREQQLAGFSWRSFNIHKRRKKTNSTETASADNREQQLLYRSIDLYFLHPLNTELHSTIGLREDYFQNLFRQLDLEKDSYDYHLWTLQFYAILRQQTAVDRFWEYGLYGGDTDKVTNYLSTAMTDKTRRKHEAKLRVSKEFRNLSNHSALMLTTSWNLDNFFNDFWDGGNISYQQTF
ncbi:MAG: hypothetical protein H8E38_13355 [SAR324 cluster bacterium]|nr:hypothetical protein [SAR324 cluster bacterium]MBL7034723.1 hypothetical protein [SAR324 cluster bacterium]